MICQIKNDFYYLINQQHQKIKIIITNIYLNNTLYKYNISNNIYKINNKIIFCFTFLFYFNF